MYTIATMVPPPESLRCFLAAARLLSFRAAAQSVALTPAALGQRIAGLERAVGARVFERSTRKVTLTDAGRALLPAAESALAALEACVRAVRGPRAPMPFELVLGTRHELGMSWIVPQLPALRRQFPHVTFHLYFGSGHDLLLRVRGQQVGCAVGSMRADDPKLAAATLHREDYVFVASPALLRTRPLRDAADARAHVLVDERAELPLFAYWRDAPGAPRLSFRQNVYRGTIAAIRDAVLRQEGVAVLPRYLVRGDLRARRLTVIFPRVTPHHDQFRLFFRADDTRRSFYETLATAMARAPLR